MAEQTTLPPRGEDHRALKLKANWVNMVIALGACLALVLVGLAFVPTPKEGQFDRQIDYAEAAAAAQPGAEFTLAVPEVPAGWVANEAMMRPMGAPAFDTWYVSWIGPKQEWVSLRQSAGDERWQANLLEDYVETGADDIAGTRFTRFDGPERKQALAAEVDGTRVLLIGRAQPQTFVHFAEQIVTAAQS